MIEAPVRASALLADVVTSDHAALVATTAGPALFFEHALNGTTQVCFQRLSQTGGREYQPITISRSPRSALQPSVSALDGGVLLAWIDTRRDTRGEDCGPHLYTGLIPWSANGALLDANVLREHKVARCDGLTPTLEVAASRTQSAVLVWQSFGQRSCVNAMLLARDGAPLSIPLMVSSGASPAVAVGQRNALIAWQETGERGITELVTRALRVDKTFGFAGPTRRILPNAMFAALCGLPDGSFTLACCTRGPEPAILVARLSHDGALVGTPRRLNSASRRAHRPALALRGEDLHVAWIASGSDTDANERLVVDSFKTWINGSHDPGRTRRGDDTTEVCRGCPSGVRLLALPDGLLVAWREGGRLASALSVARIRHPGGSS